MFDRMVQHGDAPTRHSAESTLNQMHRLANERIQTFIDVLPETVEPQKHRMVFDAQQKRQLHGPVARSEHEPPTADAVVNQAFDGAGSMWDFLDQVFHRKSIDGHGMRLDATVHYGTGFQNAMWNGYQLVCGDGDGHLLGSFTKCLAVIGHEYGHGLTQSVTALGYYGQTGALNEHIADVVGMMLRQWAARETVDQSDWFIGGPLLGPGVTGRGIRSMADPGTAYDDAVLGRDPQPKHMDHYVETAADHGGVHINSGIPNHAFYLAAKAIGGFSWEVPGRIWYATLTERLTSDAIFDDLARATVDIAGERYGNGGDVQRAVALAWDQVGIDVPLFHRHRAV
ncbi:MAG TPA: M4 family metallopeptidase [Thermoanaerobaculia bacterium]